MIRLNEVAKEYAGVLGGVLGGRVRALESVSLEVPAGTALGIEGPKERRVTTLSKGNLQRLALAQALLGERKLMILDEPTDGIDPEWTARVREILFRWREADPERVLLFASHNLDEVERVADRVAVLGEGRLREVIELRSPSAALPPYRIEVEGEPAAVAALMHEIFPDAAAEDGAPLAFRVSAPDLPTLNRRLARFLERGGTLRALTPERQSLEQQFRRALTPRPPLPLAGEGE